MLEMKTVIKKRESVSNMKKIKKKFFAKNKVRKK